jgi:hypothetical protein
VAVLTTFAIALRLEEVAFKSFPEKSWPGNCEYRQLPGKSRGIRNVLIQQPGHPFFPLYVFYASID